jgi:signal transduction histidine kinase
LNDSVTTAPGRRTGLGGLRIRHKLLLAYSTLFLCVAVTSNIIVYWLVQRAVRSNIESQLSTTNETIATMVRTSAQLSVRNRLRAIAEKNREITLHFYDRMQRGELSEGEAKARAEEVMLSQSIGSTGYLYLLDSHGVIVTHPKTALIGQDLSQFGFIREQLRRKTGYLEYQWKNPDETLERPKALYMVPFEPWGWIISASCYRDEFHQLVDVEDFHDRILSVRFGQTGYPYVLDGRGNVVIHPLIKGNVRDVVDSEGNRFVQEILERKTGSIVYTWQNPGETRYRTKLALFSHLPEYDWFVISASYYDEFYAPVRRVRNVFIISTLVTLFLLVPFSLVISLGISRPLGDLMSQLKQATEGDLSVRMVPKSRDEVGQLAEIFNGLMRQLERKENERARMEQEKERYMERLRQSEKLEAVGQLAGGIAHDFNNMLAAIMGHSELMGREPLTARQRSSIDQILLTTSRATSLTRSLLDFSRKGTTRLEVVDAHQLLGEVANLVGHAIDKRISIVTDLAAPSSRLRVDPGQLQNAVLNLLLNARDAMPKGGQIRITTDLCRGKSLPNLAGDRNGNPGRVPKPSRDAALSAEPTGSPRDRNGYPGRVPKPSRDAALSAEPTGSPRDPDVLYLKITVADQGEGMDAETLSHAFEPFFTTKEPGKGTGLGLSSVYGCVKAHDGDVRLTSVLGKGTTVELFFALFTEPVRKTQPSPGELPLGHGHVLVVEDEPAVRRFAEEALQALGYSTAGCSDGESAVAYFMEHHTKISLAMLDLVMPRMGGREVFARFREIDPKVPILLCSGFTERGDMRGELPDAAGFLAKPYRLKELATAIEQVLQASKV